MDSSVFGKKSEDENPPSGKTHFENSKHMRQLKTERYNKLASG